MPDIPKNNFFTLALGLITGDDRLTLTKNALKRHGIKNFEVIILYIKSIRMRGYKRFYDLTIELGESQKRVVALVGPNGCGKSSVFDAMLYRITSFAGRIGQSRTEKDYKYHSLLQEPAYRASTNIEIVFSNGDFNNIFFQFKEAGKEKSLFSFRSSFRYNSNLQIKESKAVNEILNNDYGASTASDLDQRIEENYRRLLGKFNKYRDDNDLRPSEARNHIIGELNQALEKCLDLKISGLGNIESDEGTLYFKKGDSDRQFEYNVLSAGEKETVDILLDLYLRKDSYTDSIYIIDEPELHLNTSAQRALLIEINKMVPPGCQIWLATHSIGFLRALQDELKNDAQIIHFNPKNRWAAQAYTLCPIVPSRAIWQNIFSTALDDLSNLICPEIIVYCEGRAEPHHIDGSERGLDAKVLNKIFAHNYPDVLFVSSGGNTELDQRSEIAIAILSKIFPELQILVLKDRDVASGRETNEATRQQYLAHNPSSHRMLKRFEIENYLYDKEVLKKYCKYNTFAFDEDKYDASFTDISNQNLKDSTGIVKNCCNITVSINAEQFKCNLADCIDESMAVYLELEDVIFKQT